jgi:pilus assembly protein CpaB
MNRSRFLLIGVVALVLGALFSSAVYRTLQARTAAAGTPGVDVAVAANDVQVGAKLQDHDVKIVKLPPDDLPSGVFRSKTKVVGRGVILPITKGEFILPNKLAAENAGAGLPALIPPGMRAVSVRVNEVVSVAGFVVPGTRVDVLLTGNPVGGSDARTTTVLSNIEVLAAGQRLERNSAGDTSMAPVITLLVSPEDAQKVTLASSQGRIQLSLRNPLDTNLEKLPATGETGLYGITAAPAPKPNKAPAKAKHQELTKPAPATTDIVIYKGNKKEDVKFDDENNPQK